MRDRSLSVIFYTEITVVILPSHSSGATEPIQEILPAEVECASTKQISPVTIHSHSALHSITASFGNVPLQISKDEPLKG